MNFFNLKINIQLSKKNALLAAIAKELGMQIRVLTAHPDYYIVDDRTYITSTDMSYITSFNLKHPNHIKIIDTNDFINLLCEEEATKEVYERLSIIYDGFKTDSNLCLTSYTGTNSDLIIPDTITGIQNNYWCDSEFNSITIPASLSNINSYVFEPVKAVKIVIFKGITNCSNGVLNDKECAAVFEKTFLSDIPSSLKKKAALGYAIDYYTTKIIPLDFKEDYISYIKKQRKNLLPLMQIHLDLLRFAIEENIFPKKEKDEIISNIISKESIKAYQTNLIRIGASQSEKDNYVTTVIQNLKSK